MTKKEFSHILIAIIAMVLILSLSSLIKEEKIAETLVFALISSLIIILISVFSKKIISNVLDIKIEHEIWQFKRYWFAKKSEFRKGLPFGLILPLLLSFLSLGIIKFMAFFQFSSEALPGKAAKKYGMRRFSSVLDWDEALIVFYSILPLLILSAISRFVNLNFFDFPHFSRIIFYFALSNLIPCSQLDGMKLLIGSRPLYAFTLILLAITGLFIFI